MTKKIILLFVNCALLINLNAQNNSILDDLQQDKPGQGKVKIIMDKHIADLVGQNISGNSVSGDNQYLKMQGYRINMFSGNTREVKNEVFAMESQIKELFPDLATYVTYVAPIWRLRVGNFESREEATVFMQNLKDTFPAYKKEMNIVSDEIKIPIYNY